MRIGLISDTHGHLDPKVEKYFKECDEIWHIGDVGTIDIIKKLTKIKPVRGVYGNIDGQDIRKVFPKELKFTCEEVKVWLIHIGGYPNRYSKDVKDRINFNAPDLFISGHSHILKITRDPIIKNLIHMNPGAAGKEGFHKVRTIVLLEVHGKEIKNIQIVELGFLIKSIISPQIIQPNIIA